MKSQITIRPATKADFAVLVANNQAMAMETENRQLDNQILSGGVQNLLDDPNKGFYIVAEENGQVVGNLMITKEWSDWRNGDMWWFQSVFVHPEHRGKGIFKALYQHVMDLAKENGIKELRLYVEHDNVVAQKVYAALGMVKSHYDMWEVGV
ncbi:MAG: GNAT family N-acetyltransferase [Bacteroidetes bacterium]|nr:GNAT family N-acetyltransferase [Bacteroidota bacterium]MBL0017391.1 GNAT family N-acetyltransferase [Bacteroidota bacterium]